MKKLSIGVPTYNRADCLKECLESILESMQAFQTEVELVVSNNGSTDHTVSVVRALQAVHPELRYFENPTTVLHDIHFPQLLQRCEGEYFWVIGDDDKIEPDAVAVALRHIKEGPTLIVTNYSVWSKDFQTQLRAQAFDFNKDKVFKNADVIMETFGFNLAYISTTIARRADVLGIAPERTAPYSRYYVPFLFALYASLLKAPSASFIAQPISCNRANNARDGEEYDWFFVYVDGSHAIFKGLQKEGYSAPAVRAAESKVLIDYVAFRLFDLKVQNKSIPGLPKRLLKAYASFPIFWLVCLPLLFAPHRFVFQNRDRLWKILYWIKQCHL